MASRYLWRRPFRLLWVFGGNVSESVWKVKVLIGRTSHDGAGSWLHERSRTIRPELHPGVIPRRPCNRAGTSSQSRFAVDGPWTEASLSGGPILVGGGDFLEGLYEWHVGVGFSSRPWGGAGLTRPPASDLQEPSGKNLCSLISRPDFLN